MSERIVGDGLHAVGFGPPVGSSWSFARPEVLVQCCWCGEAILPGDSAMRVTRDTPPRRIWWSHYEERPCYGKGPREGQPDSGERDRA